MDQIRELDVLTIIPTKDNPRVIRKDDPKTAELAESIRKNGLLQPVICRPLPEGPVRVIEGCKVDGPDRFRVVKGQRTPGFYLTGPIKKADAERFAKANAEVEFELLAGERRFLATKLLGETKILAIVRPMDDRAALEVTVVENLQRENLTPIEEARGVKRLLQEGQDAKVIGAEIGKSPQWVIRRAKLADLHPEIIQDLEDPESTLSGTSVAHLEVLCRFNHDTQIDILKELGRQAWIWEPKNFSEFNDTIDQRMMVLKRAPFKLADATLVPKAGSCLACQKRSACNPGLFDDEMDPKALAATDKCLDRVCYEEKIEAHNALKEAELRKEHPGLIKVANDYMTPDEMNKLGAVRIDGLNIEKSKKGMPGAKPALVVAGPGVGTVMWVTQRAEGRGTRDGGRGTGGGGTDEARPMSMEEKQAQLLLRRKAWVCNHVAERLAGTAVRKGAEPWIKEYLPATTVMIVAAAFGTRGCHTEPGTAWTDFETFVKAPDKAVTELWAEVAKVMQERLKFYTTSTCERHYDEALRIAKLCEMPEEAELLALAAKEIPEPKAWSKGKEGRGSGVEGNKAGSIKGMAGA